MLPAHERLDAVEERLAGLVWAFTMYQTYGRTETVAFQREIVRFNDAPSMRRSRDLRHEYRDLVKAILDEGMSTGVFHDGNSSILALQIAKAMGATVAITSSSDEKLARARELGAHITVNYNDDPEWGRTIKKQTGGADIVLESAGAQTLPQSLRAVKPGGVISLIGVVAGDKGDAGPVEATGRLVHDQDLRPADSGDADKDAAGHAAGQMVRVEITGFRCQAKARKRRGSGRLAGHPRQAGTARRPAELVVDPGGGVEARQGLRRKGDAPSADGAQASVGHRLAVQEQRPAALRASGQHADEGRGDQRLADAGLSRQRQDPTRVDGKRDAGYEAAPVHVDRQILRLYHRAASGKGVSRRRRWVPILSTSSTVATSTRPGNRPSHQ